MRPITRHPIRNAYRAWLTRTGPLPAVLMAIWFIGFADHRAAYAHADTLNNARCAACGGYCRVLPPETRCIACQIHGRYPEGDTPTAIPDQRVPL